MGGGEGQGRDRGPREGRENEQLVQGCHRKDDSANHPLAGQAVSGVWITVSGTILRGLRRLFKAT